MRLLIVLLVVALDGCAANTGNPEPRFVSSATAVANDYPFSNMVEADGWVFLSGDLGLDPATGRLAPGGIGPEARQTMTNIRTSLESEGLGMSSVVKCTVMLADMSEWAIFNEVYKSFFDGRYPARSAFGANGLALDARVEVECIARR